MTPTSRYRVQSLQQAQISTSLHHERIMLAPLSQSEATTLAVGLRRCLLKGFEGTCFSTLKIKHPWVTKNKKRCYEYLALPGIRETIRDIMMNLSSVVLAGIPIEKKKAKLYTGQEVGVFEARHIILPEGIYCLSPNQPILTVVVPLELELELTIERGSGFRIRDGGEHEDGLFLDARFNPILQVDYQIQRAERKVEFDRNEKISNIKQEALPYKIYQKNSLSITKEQTEKKEQIDDELSEKENTFRLQLQNEQEQDYFCILFFDIWTNGTIQPIEAMQEAARQAIAVYIPLLRFASTVPLKIIAQKKLNAKYD
nr:RNA polymerase alpha subunit [Klebsormidium dissectum]WKT07694.1 RNA polymerase alpha subunit [Klebsormidium sp. SEV1-VF17pt]